ncbi:HD domain-containing protein [Bacillus shivajii]|uniref:HD domain-containing protein n=1 Tax=Bacillus shivajii TaxID=1983719 RepID=UPI001CFA9967|nr:HD domain-containing protein [Bacillus shivajii]UCZ54921.1 HD domain-containing protein [Bacillus shivajii]
MNLENIHHAVVFATKAHEGQVRKTEKIPYITHPYTAALYAIPYLEAESFTEKEKTDIVSAILLHDVWEDTDISIETIEKEFGNDVTQLVKIASESDKTMPWLERKKETIKKLETATLGEKYVICADKVHNLTSLKESVDRSDEDIWIHFKSDKDSQQWYYTSIYEGLIHGGKSDHPFFAKLKKLIDEVFA